MIIIGIDPGSVRVGFGVVDFNSKTPKFIEADILDIKSLDKNQRLVDLEESFVKILDKYKPDVMGIEKIYFVKNVKTGIEVAQSRGVLIFSALKRGIKIKEFAPLEVKQYLTGYGKADKKGVLKVVKQTLNIGEFKKHDDVSDALAIALVTGYSLVFDKFIK